ncbi:MAG TPA: phenylalanine--tRNA ligase subunit beta [Terriglobales bacterium]|jgi:phenylalanyl-tRNA synthetase beta chain|nr:phenylalanine--tRNA ligase subunit beta [Terriglobales bacterium]
MRIIPSWLREFVDVPADDRRLAEDLTSVGIAVESVQEESGSTVYEMDLTTNRVDAMNHYGVAREVSAIYNVALKPVAPKLPKPKVRRAAPPNISGPIGMTSLTEQMEAAATSLEADAFPIVIEDPQGCARYTARIVRNVKIGPSPDKVVKRLELLGSRSINNVADATNYALNELGHPTHAFDLDLLEGGTIIVRRAREGEVLKTLDGVDRKLTTEDLVIADAKKPVALAGVMGGFDTMITERTKNVLIESAWFEPWTVRSMAKRHLMHTDASHRFERGADYGITPLACDRVAELILASAGGELQGERVDAVGRELERPPIPLRHSEIRRHLGIDLAESEVERILSKLGFGVTQASSRVGAAVRATETGTAVAVEIDCDLIVNVPSWRLDVEREIDLLEELARIYGYNNFPNTLPAFTGGVVELPDEAKNVRVREIMLALGYNEAISITFIAEQDAKTFIDSESPRNIASKPAPLAVANPLSEESAFMRTSLLPGLLNIVSYNLNRGTNDVFAFEMGEIFGRIGDDREERRHLAFAATGNVVSKSVHSEAQTYTFFHMKGAIEKLLSAFQHGSVQSDTTVPAYLHPGRSARVVLDGETVAYFGQLHPDQAAARKLRQEVYIAEVMLDRLYKHDLREPRYQRISKFPAVDRDFSFVFDDGVTFERIHSAVAALGISELQSFVPAEIYRGEKVGAGKYSALLRAEFQSQERTLRDDEVAEWSNRTIKKLQELGGVLRAQ